MTPRGCRFAPSDEKRREIRAKHAVLHLKGLELKAKGLLGITQHRGRDPGDTRVGYRNERNSFDISPFVRLVAQAHKIRREERPLKGKEEGDRES